MKKLLIAILSLSAVACSSTDDALVAPRYKPAVNSMSMAHKELLEIIEEQRILFENYQGEITDKLQLAHMNTKYKKIVSRWQNYIAQHPDDVDAIIIYGKFLRAVGEFEKAYISFLEVDKINPNIAVVKQQLASFQGDYGAYKEALANINKAIELSPNEAIYYYQKAELLCAYYDNFINENIYEQSSLNALIEEAFEKAIELSPQQIQLYRRYAQSFYQQRSANWESALKAWEMLDALSYMKLEKHNVALNKARVLIELFRDDEALQILEQIDSPTLQDSKARLIAIIQAQDAGDLQAEASLKAQEKEIIETEFKQNLEKKENTENE